MLSTSPLIVDCHLDLAWNALGYKRDLTLALAGLNRGEQGLADHAGRGLATTTLPEMRAGDVRAHAKRWRASNEHRVGIVLAMEGSDPIITPAHVQGRYWPATRTAAPWCRERVSSRTNDGPAESAVTASNSASGP